MVDQPERIAWSSLVDEARELFCISGARSCSMAFWDDLSVRITPWFPPSYDSWILVEIGSFDSVGMLNVLSTIYPLDHKLSYVVSMAMGQVVVGNTLLRDLGNLVFENDVGRLAFYVPSISHDSSFEAFQELVARLRAPDGCPWDRVQTHQSLRTSLLSETYELLSAIDSDSPSGIKEEVGDLLLQVLLHTQIGKEAGTFNMPMVIQHVHQKLIRRHPHVFGKMDAEDADMVLRNWEEIKASEREAHQDGENRKGMLDSVPLILPALAQAQDYQARVARVGFDWDTIAPVRAKVLEELDEISRSGNAEELEGECGDLLFAAVNLVRWCGVDSESALRLANQRFRSRFAYVEERAAQIGRKLQDMTLAEMDIFWEEAKRSGVG